MRLINRIATQKALQTAARALRGPAAALEGWPRTFSAWVSTKIGHKPSSNGSQARCRQAALTEDEHRRTPSSSFHQ
jgi:hypothetical protein